MEHRREGAELRWPQKTPGWGGRTLPGSGKSPYVSLPPFAAAKTTASALTSPPCRPPPSPRPWGLTATGGAGSLLLSPPPLKTSPAAHSEPGHTPFILSP